MKDPILTPLVKELSVAAKDSADKIFLRHNRNGYSFHAIWQQVEQVARGLSAYVLPNGTRVAIQLPNGPDWVVCWFAVHRLGLTVVPVNYAYKSNDLSYVLEDSGAKLLITDEAGRELVAGGDWLAQGGIVVGPGPLKHKGIDGGHLPAVDEIALDDVANLQYTSGTTGFPKGCVLTQRYWVEFGAAIGRNVAITAQDVMLTSQPFSYIDPQWNTAVCLLNRIPLAIKDRFSASRFWSWVREEKVTLFYVLGSMPILLYKQPPSPDDRNNDVRLVVCSGIPADLHADLEARWGAPWREAFGMTETGVDLVVPLEDVGSVGSGSVGWPIAGKEARVVTPDGQEAPVGSSGELVIRGRPMMEGYWNNPAATVEIMRDGWFHTGDVAVMAEDGSFSLRGRIKDMVRRSGENIASSEVEGVANQHPAVLSAAVIGVPDELWGEEVKLFVQLRPGEVPSESTAQNIFAHMEERLAKFKLPKYIEFVDKFQKTPSERIIKNQINDRFKKTGDRVFDFDI